MISDGVRALPTATLATNAEPTDRAVWPQRLAAAAIDLGSLADIAVTHMHMNHVGGLLVDGAMEQLRPDVWIQVCATEAQFWESLDFWNTTMPSPVPPVLSSAARRFAKEVRSPS